VNVALVASRSMGGPGATLGAAADGVHGRVRANVSLPLDGLLDAIQPFTEDRSPV
jgi:hypothetical protein